MNQDAQQAVAALESPDMLEIDLRDPTLAAFLAWLIPGAGHFYQRRYAKGLIFFICILGTFFFGLYLGEGRVVYASMRSGDMRLPYLCQVGVGIPAMPAMIQAHRVRNGRDPLWDDFMAPPKLSPRGGDLAEWHFRLHRYFELGTVYTMIAGLLNVLVIYDAWGGPLMVAPTRPEEPADRERKEKPPDDSS